MFKITLYNAYKFKKGKKKIEYEIINERERVRDSACVREVKKQVNKLKVKEKKYKQ